MIHTHTCRDTYFICFFIPLWSPVSGTFARAPRAQRALRLVLLFILRVLITVSDLSRARAELYSDLPPLFSLFFFFFFSFFLSIGRSCPTALSTPSRLPPLRRFLDLAFCLAVLSAGCAFDCPFASISGASALLPRISFSQVEQDKIISRNFTPSHRRGGGGGGACIGRPALRRSVSAPLLSLSLAVYLYLCFYFCCCVLCLPAFCTLHLCPSLWPCV